MFQEMLENVRGKCPLIHNITNYVTVNDCANIVLAAARRPSCRTTRARSRKSRRSAVD